MSLLLSCKYNRAGVELEEGNHLGLEKSVEGQGMGLEGMFWRSD